ncbi:MAG: DUF494 family protein [Calditrichaeota bacterium]|nr:DUF494 family protein [Calditrichota bacterium]
MDARVMEIVLYIMDSINSTTDENILSQIKDISDMLVERGYTETEIKSAFDVLMESESEDETEPVAAISKKQKTPKKLTKKRNDSAEASTIQKHFIFQVNELDIVGDEEIERIINRSMLRGQHGTSISEIKAIIDHFIFDPHELQSNSFFVINQKQYGH